jgi:hypothetical protein
MDLNLIDKLSLDNISELENRDKHFRIVINNKIYDTSHEDDIAHYVINNTKFKDMLLIRFEYYLSKVYHGLGRGDMVFYDKLSDKLYVLELKSLKDKYSNTTDTAKIEKCIAQSIKYSEYTTNWASRESIPVSVIELSDGKIQITEKTTFEKPIGKISEKLTGINQSLQNLPLYLQLEPDELILLDKTKPKLFPWTSTIQKKEQEEMINDKWFTHPGDQTLTQYKINGDTLESIRIVDYLPSSGSRRAFRKRVKRVCQECSNCIKYYISLKNTCGDILMQELHEINEADEI